MDNVPYVVFQQAKGQSLKKNLKQNTHRMFLAHRAMQRRWDDNHEHTGQIQQAGKRKMTEELLIML